MRWLLLCVVFLAPACDDDSAATAPDMTVCSGDCVTARCADQMRDGDESDVDCGGACAACAIGKLCVVATDCVTGFCSAGTCAARPPGATCSDNTQCGSGICGANGTGNCCAAACTAGSGTCAWNGCDGTGACTYPSTMIACAPETCVDSTLTRHYCDGFGGCATDTITCPNLLACASATSCSPSCADDSDCIPGYYCSAGCHAKGGIGASCGFGSQCLSGNCVDGFCCMTACNGACQACAASLTGGTDGVCSGVLDGHMDPRMVCGDSTSICEAGACSGAPSMPAAVMSASGPSSATISWTVPAANGASIDSYVISGAGAPISVPAAGACSGSTVGSPCNYTVTPLTNCTTYNLVIVAHNANGNSAPASAPAVVPAQPADTPSAPTVTVPANPGASLTVGWSAPGDHGCAIDQYDVYITGATNGGDHVVGVVLSTTLGGLTTCNYPSGTCGLAYTFNVRAHNAGGWSNYSVPSSGNPKVSYASDNVAGIWGVDTCTSCHTSAQPPNLADASAAYASSSAEGALIYLCPENAAPASCPSHPVLMTAGDADDKTLRQWVSDGEPQ
ncbi:MAG TPA: fibronectin type III domain-containing protein [Polyangia bacterium]